MRGYRPMRHNPPLSEHMEHDDLHEIAAALDDRFYMLPADGIDFVLRCLEPIYARLDATLASTHSRARNAESLHRAAENVREAKERLQEALEQQLQAQYAHAPHLRDFEKKLRSR
jgi:hypothetical protein